MKIIENTKLIERNAKIGKYTFFASLAIFGIGLYVSFSQQSNNDPKILIWTMAALIVGYIISQISISYQNRFGKTPRPDQLITAALKGMGEKYTLFHYSSPISHMLIGPTGVWAIIPFSQPGTILYTNGKWKHKGGSILQKFFGGDNLGRPDIEADSAIRDLTKSISAVYQDDPMPPIRALLLFTNPKAELETEESPILTATSKKIKDTIRKSDKAVLLNDEKVKEISKIYIEAFEQKK